MTTLKALPVRPSLQSLRKQAKKLARDVAAGNPEAAARARAQLTKIDLPLSQRNAQLVLAREYGFAGWQDLRAEVLKRVGKGLEWASVQAKRAIHDNDVEGLKRLLADYPALLSWRDELGRVLLHATTSFALDASSAERERTYTRPACAELLIEAGAAIEPSVWNNVIITGTTGMLQLLRNKGVLPHTLPILAALGDLDGVHACFDGSGASRVGGVDADRLATVNEAFMYACRFKHLTVATQLLERCIALDAALGRRIDAWQSRSAFIEFLSQHPLHGTDTAPPWRAFVIRQLISAIDEDALAVFGRWLRDEPELLGESGIGVQVELLERAACCNREPFISQLLDLDPQLLRLRPPPQSSALVFALEYGNAQLIPLLTRIWPLPDDLPHAAGMGDFAGVKRWFDAAGRPRLGNPNNHYPGNNPQVRANLLWGASNVQQVLDVALAWACMNRQLEIAAFLVEHGADVNTRWATHQPASILHECAMKGNYEAARFLIDRGIDMTIRDHCYHATAEGWARHAARNEQMAEFLAAAQGQSR